MISLDLILCSAHVGRQWIRRSHYAAKRNAALAGHYAGYKDTFLRV
ncbi:hypothetical protein [Glutamicibacter creatinolyticus]|uniref:Uncharacterized protein n=1 Tax=Glutamicibacter creatinolyticus TaxID=162496 RepID=A0A5B7WXD8_9MICC|nr:hypothetical protein [Glutamicibacter creatinolyticus]QCY48572.1 hypothetical protein GcLGCM259_2865 [Glutamicibacter creatinolyticus]